MIEYLAKSTFCLSILYLGYVVFFRYSRNYQINRIILLFSVIFSLSIPILKISIAQFQSLEIIPNKLINVFSVPNYLPGSELTSPVYLNNSVGISTVLTVIYSLITLALFGRFAFNIYMLFLKGYRSDKIDHKGNELTLIDEIINPFSFFNLIFINKDYHKNGAIEEELILHEMAHKKQLHSIDLVLIELVQVFFWFNPFIYLFKNLIKTNHEYLADEFVLKSGACPFEYSNTLLNHAFQNKTLSLTSGFNHLLIKNRLIMLSKFEQKKRFIYPLALFVPIVAVLFFTTSFTGTNNAIIDKATGTVLLTQKPGIFYADTLFWSGEDHEVYMRGKVKVRYGINDFTGDGGFAILGKVHLLVFNDKPVSLNSTIILTGIKCEVLKLTEKEAIEKYGSEGKLGAVEIKAIK